MRGRRVCVVNSYNYAGFLGECLDSALAQTVPFDRIIVVDDGSTDRSRDLIQRYAAEHAALLPVLKDNGGQLSCFNAAVPHIEPDDLVFFLDADDIYPPDYVEKLSRTVASHCGDFYFCTAHRFTDDQSRPYTAAASEEAPPVLLPRSSAITLAAERWIGSPTSALAITGRLYLKILPYAREPDWVVRADDVIVFAASILGARKVYAPAVRVGYRIHGNNLFTGNAHWQGRAQWKRHQAKFRGMFDDYCRKAGVARIPGRAELAAELALLDESARQTYRLRTASAMAAFCVWRNFRDRLRGFFSKPGFAG